MMSVSILKSTPQHRHKQNIFEGIMMKVLLVVLVSIAVTSACDSNLIPTCDVYTECKCGNEIETCCSKTFACQGG